jgi:hypothetical protein
LFLGCLRGHSLSLHSPRRKALQTFFFSAAGAAVDLPWSAAKFLSRMFMSI